MWWDSSVCRGAASGLVNLTVSSSNPIASTFYDKNCNLKLIFKRMAGSEKMLKILLSYITLPSLPYNLQFNFIVRCILDS